MILYFISSINLVTVINESVRSMFVFQRPMRYSIIYLLRLEEDLKDNSDWCLMFQIGWPGSERMSLTYCDYQRETRTSVPGHLSECHVGRIMTPQRCSHPYLWMSFTSKRVFADVLKVKNLEKGRLSWIAWMSLWSFISTKGRSGRRMSQWHGTGKEEAETFRAQ